MDSEVLILAMAEVIEKTEGNPEARKRGLEFLAQQAEEQPKKPQGKTIGHTRVKPSPFRKSLEYQVKKRSPGEVWQGQSGRWFTMTQDNRVVPTEAPGGKEPTEQQGPKKGEPPKKQTMKEGFSQFIQSTLKTVKDAKQKVGLAARKLLAGAGRKTHRLPRWMIRKVAHGVVAVEHALNSFAHTTHEMVEEVAKERGLSHEHTERVNKIVKTTDAVLQWTVNVPATAAMGAPFLAVKGSGLLPIAGLAYLSYSTARDPLATARAAGKLAREKAHQIKEKAGKLKEKVTSKFGRKPDNKIGETPVQQTEKKMSYRVKNGFTGNKVDSIGRERCYQSGEQVSCNPGQEQKPSAPATEKIPSQEAKPKPSNKNEPNPSLPDASRPKLSEEEMEAVEAYTGTLYSEINKCLRNRDPNAWSRQALEVHKTLMKAFAKTKGKKFAKPVLAYRGLLMEEGALKKFLTQAKESMDTGKLQPMLGYSSTSTYELDPNFKDNVEMRIQVIRGLDLKPYSEKPEEDELLLNHNTLIKVTGIKETSKEDGSSKYIIECEQVIQE